MTAECRAGTYLYGENLDAMDSISCSLIYFSFEMSRPMYVAIPRLWGYQNSQQLSPLAYPFSKHCYTFPIWV